MRTTPVPHTEYIIVITLHEVVADIMMLSKSGNENNRSHCLLLRTACCVRRVWYTRRWARTLLESWEMRI